MIRKTLCSTALAIALALPLAAPALDREGFRLDVLVGGCSQPEYHARGTVYVEALRDREYSLRITNPYPYRVAVALSVDGLNTIDAKHASARNASKWVLDPYASVVISGWQVSGETARRFYFTGEKDSYGAWLGETDNLGVIEAVFYREKVRPRPTGRTFGAPPCEEMPRGKSEGSPSSRESKHAPERSMESQAPADLSDDYAATGIGDEVRHEVQWIDLKLEKSPCATLRIRYEFRPQLVRLGVLPPAPCRPDPLNRREGAEGFQQSYCPNPPVRRR